MRLFENFLTKEINKIIEKEVKIKFIGKLDMFSKKMQKLMKDVEEKSKNNKTTLFLAMSYGGRLEIVEAVKKLSQEKTKEEIESLTENEFEKYL
jgi:undecaprenyl diphosphate synthase